VLETIVVAGTATEVGKTWVTAEVARLLREQGFPVAARKPAQSFSPDDGRTDAEVLAAATGEDVAIVCPRHRWYPVPMAPPMAADALERDRIALAVLVAEIKAPGDGVMFVEGVGGPRSPVAHDGDTIDLAERLGAEGWLLVADAGLGTINAVLLSIQAFGSSPLAVHLNRYDSEDDLQRRNRAWLVDRLDCPVTVAPEELVTIFRSRRNATGG
jgi:dethiobiotin synthetase